MECVQGLFLFEYELKLATKPNGFSQFAVWLMINRSSRTKCFVCQVLTPAEERIERLSVWCQEL